MYGPTDKPLARPRNSRVARLRRNILTGAKLVAVVFGVAALPVVFLYVAGFSNGDVPATSPAAALPREDEPMAAMRVAALDRRALAFVGVNVVPMDREGVLRNQTVVVRDGRIAAIGPAATVRIPSGAVRVDATGKYLLPGLTDAHVHLRDFDEETNLRLFDLFIANGVTTVLNLYGTPQHLELRARLAQGELAGPIIFTSGPFISNLPAPPPEPDEIERDVVAQKRAGYDIIKTHGNFTPDGFRRLFDVAKREGIRVIGHSPRNLGHAAMTEHGQHAVAHAEEYLYDTQGSSRNAADLVPRIPEIASATVAAGTWLVPNLSAYHGIAEQANDVQAMLARPEVQYVPARIARGWQPDRNTYARRFNPSHYQGFRARYHVLEQITKGFQDAGVGLLAGTDTPIPCVVPGFSLHDELRLLVAAGLTPYQALRAATANAAAFLGGDAFGTVEKGKRADLVLVDANPLEDVANASRIAGVMLRGRWLPREELQATLERNRN